MSILLIILKIIGILLLVILILTALFLFHPIFYQIEGEAEEEISAEGYFWWLFQILRLEFRIENMEAQWRFRIFGFYRNSTEKKSEKKESNESKESKEETLSAVRPEEKIEYESVNHNQSGPVDKVSDKTDIEEHKDERSKEKDSSLKKDEQNQKKRERKKKNREKQDRKKKDRKKQFGNLKKEITDSGNHQAVSHVWKELCYLLSHLSPKYLKAEISFSTGDPASTGGVTGALALFPVIYRYDAHIYPDFLSEEFYIRGSLQLKGHMALFHFIRSLIRLMRDKNVKRLYGKIRK